MCGVLSTLTLPMITREQWGAKPPKHIEPLKLPVPYVIIHHTYIPDVCNTTEQCIKSMQSMQRFHQVERKWDDIGYNFAVGGDGNIYEGRGWDRIGAHARSWNNKSIGIVLIGDYTDKNPSSIMQKRAHEIIAFGVSNDYIDKGYTLYGHRQVGNTECPGNMFFETLKTWPHWEPK